MLVVDLGGSGVRCDAVSKVTLSSDEIEVACDALWHRRAAREFTAQETVLWERLQIVRHGDYGGSASIELAQDEVTLISLALKFDAAAVALDDDEAALLQRLDRDPES
jgi:hypothetical protein